MKRPESAFDVAWGASLAAAVERFGIACEQRYSWRDPGEFRVCRGKGSLLGFDAWIEVVTQDDRFEGVFVTFTNTACTTLAASVREALAVPENVDPMVIAWDSGEVIRFDETAAGCMLTAAGPRLGAHIQREHTADAFSALSGGLRP